MTAGVVAVAVSLILLSSVSPSAQTVGIRGTFTDPRDGQTYRTVVMPDGKTWMAQNLNYDTADGRGSWCYNNELDSCAKYGRLYDWKVAEKVCPVGWHLPDDHEWGTLMKSVEPSWKPTDSKKTSYGYNGHLGISKATDKHGFSALPAGMRWFDGSFRNIGSYGYWWSDSNSDAPSVWNCCYRSIGVTNDTVLRGFSVRCVRDDWSALSVPAIFKSKNLYTTDATSLKFKNVACSVSKFLSPP